MESLSIPVPTAQPGHEVQNRTEPGGEKGGDVSSSPSLQGLVPHREGSTKSSLSPPKDSSTPHSPTSSQSSTGLLHNLRNRRYKKKESSQSRKSKGAALPVHLYTSLTFSSNFITYKKMTKVSLHTPNQFTDNINIFKYSLC